MSLKDDKRQNIQMELDFSSEPAGEAQEAGGEETESSVATNGTESPANTNRLMEAVCERENLKAALRQVQANKGSPGVDGMTVVGLKDYLQQHWPTIREQLLNGIYEPKPVRRVEIPKPDGGVRKLGVTDSNRRVRTRTHGGVTGGGGRPPPLCRSKRLRPRNHVSLEPVVNSLICRPAAHPADRAFEEVKRGL
jgi:hypothetical protein